jgi:hypothetical protein
VDVCAPIRHRRGQLYVKKLAILPILALLAGCPEERPGSQRQIPAQAVPPAVSIEPPSPDAGPPAHPRVDAAARP